MAYEVGTIKLGKAAYEGDEGGDITTSMIAAHNAKTKELSVSEGASSGKSFVQLAGAGTAAHFGLPPQAGSFIAGIGYDLGLSFSKKEETESAGEREASGWGKMPAHVLPKYEFTFQGDHFELSDWKAHRSFWNPDDTTEYVGFILKRNGQPIADHVVYVWVENNTLFMQQNISPYDHSKEAGDVHQYLGLPGKNFRPAGNGVVKNPKAQNVPGGGTSAPKDNFVRKSGIEEPKLSVVNPGSIDASQYLNFGSPQNNFAPGATPPLVGGSGNIFGPGNNTPNSTDKEKDNEAKKDNTTLYIVIAAIVLALILIFK